MAPQLRLSLWVGAALLIAFHGIPHINAAGPARAVVVTAAAVRERANASTSIVISASTLEELPLPRRLDQILATLPTDRKVTPGHLPNGWQFEQRGNTSRSWGTGAETPYLRFDFNGNYSRDYIGKPASIRLGFDGKLEAPLNIQIGSLPKVSTTSALDGILTLPPQGVLNMPILIGVTPAYRSGTWDITNGTSATPLLPLDAISEVEVKIGPSAASYGIDPGALVQLKSKPAPRPYVARFNAWDMAPRVKYTDPFGEVTVDAPIKIAPVTPGQGRRVLSSGSRMTFAGQAACVSGNFPNLTDAYGLMLDGQTELVPWAVSPTTVMLGIPPATTAGPHTVTDPIGSSSVTIGVLTVEAALDQTKLWRGESTTMRLRVVGTDEPLPISLLNRTPGIITIEGGVQQAITTPGGADNAFTRQVTGIMRGDFGIVYSVNIPGCGTK